MEHQLLYEQVYGGMPLSWYKDFSVGKNYSIVDVTCITPDSNSGSVIDLDIVKFKCTHQEKIHGTHESLSVSLTCLEIHNDIVTFRAVSKIYAEDEYIEHVCTVKYHILKKTCEPADEYQGLDVSFLTGPVDKLSIMTYMDHTIELHQSTQD